MLGLKRCLKKTQVAFGFVRLRWRWCCWWGMARSCVQIRRGIYLTTGANGLWRTEDGFGFRRKLSGSPEKGKRMMDGGEDQQLKRTVLWEWDALGSRCSQRPKDRIERPEGDVGGGRRFPAGVKFQLMGLTGMLWDLGSIARFA